MLGYWHSKNPVTINNENIKCTVYLKENAAMICIYNFSAKKESICLNINKELLGFDYSDILTIPEINNYQKCGNMLISDNIELDGR